MKSPIVLLESLFKDIKRLLPDVQGLDRDVITIKKRFEQEGYGFLTIALPALDGALTRALSTGKFACPVGFKTVKGGTIPRFLSGMFCKMFESSTGALKEDFDVGVLKCVRNILMLFKKMKLSPEHEDKLHAAAVATFFECDTKAGLVVIPDRHLAHIQRVAKLILNTLTNKDVENAVYRHGPGSVEEGYRANQKWVALSDAIWNGKFDSSDIGFDVQNHLHFRYSDTLHKVPSIDKPTDGQKLPDRCGGDDNGFRWESRGIFDFNGASRGSARLISVLKNSSARRTITIEPMLNQFVQQGLNILVRESIRECRILSNCLALSDQTANQKLALEGSLLDNWATIDLKAASDLMSVKLVEAVFGHHGQFFDRMMDCRSPQVYEGSNAPMHLRKFAGMGNALTFPVQSICFAAISMAAILDSEGSSPSYWNLRRASRHIRVFGDDIIVSRKYAHQVVNWLHDFGLQVNVKKSFLEGNFKESCGVDAFRGIDVTPHYIKHRPDESSTEPSIIAGLVSLSNHTWMDCLYELSTCLKEEVESRLRKTLPLVSKDSGLLGWHSRLDSSHVTKWCMKTHQFLIRAGALFPVKRKDALDGYAALLKYFCTANSYAAEDMDLATRIRHINAPRGTDNDHLKRSPIRFKTLIRSNWVPIRLNSNR